MTSLHHFSASIMLVGLTSNTLLSNSNLIQVQGIVQLNSLQLLYASSFVIYVVLVFRLSQITFVFISKE